MADLSTRDRASGSTQASVEHSEDWLRRSRQLPSWLFSLVLHLALLLLLALLPLAEYRGQALTLFFGESEGHSVDFSLTTADRFTMQAAEELEVETSLESATGFSEIKFEEVAEIAELLESEIKPLGVEKAASISKMLSGRSFSQRAALLASGGGSAETERAVEMGLEWLARNQLSSGGWSLSGKYSDGGDQENQTAATAMALNAFLGAGYTHQDGKYAEVVDRGLTFLLKRQNSEGFFAEAEPAHHRAYAQALASITVLEAYGLSGDTSLRGPAQLAIKYAEYAQSPLRGWRYVPKTDADVSVTGWFVMALATARMVGLKVNDEKLDSVNGYLDSVAFRDLSAYAYKESHGPDLTMTAEGLLCRILLGWPRSHPALRAGVAEVVLNVPDQSEPLQSVYFWYYATQVLHHYGGQEWDLWNAHMKKTLPALQVPSGPEKGSWSPERDMYGRVGGRLYTTCLSIYCLEVYYRHLAIYSVE